MPTPDLLLGESSRIGMLRGFESMARLLAITLGPVGGNIANAREPRGEPELLYDAATVARRIISLPDRAEDAGAMLMRHIVWNVREQMGDGSATTAVLAQAIARETEKVIAAGANAMIIRRGIEKGLAAAVKAIEEMSEPLEEEDRIAAVATAAIGYPEIGKLLGEIYDVLGPNAAIVIEPYVATYHDRAYHEGARFRGEMLSPYMVTDTIRRIAVLEDVYILVADMSFKTVESASNMLEQVMKAGGKNLLIICKGIDDKAMGVLVANNEAGTIQSCATKLKPIGDLRIGTFENICSLTGAQFLSDKTGMDPNDISIDDMGYADRIVSTKDYFVIVGGHGDRKAQRERLKKLRTRLRESGDADEREMLRELVTHFSTGVASLRIGALTEQERKSITEVAEHAIKTVQAGMEAGVVPGGGAAYLAAIPAVEAVEAEGDEAIGLKVLARALQEPMRCIVANAGEHPPLAMAEAQRQGPGYGFEVTSKKTVHMLDAGIADPTSVVRRALQQAVSGALMLLTTDALVLHAKPEETFEP